MVKYGRKEGVSMSSEVVTTKYGQVRGKQVNGHYEFLGIPYAKPPVNELRWKPPVEMNTYTGIVDATRFKNRAVQALSVAGTFYHKEFYSEPCQCDRSENCLYLNIWTKDPDSSKKMPVAVWIHGGAFDHGYGNELPFDGTVYTEHDVILVTFNYRLGVFGFLSHPELVEEAGTCGNYGLMDQIMALRWVKENIEAFGGDSNNITIFGQSAGAMSVQYLLCSEYAQPFFNKCIMQSGAGLHTPFMGKQSTIEENFIIADEFLEELGVTTIEEARKVDCMKVFEVQQRMANKTEPKNSLLFMPSIDHVFLKESCDEAIENNRFHNIPTIIGSNGNEMGMNIITKGLLRASGEFAEKCHEYGNDDVYCYLFTRELPGDDAGAFHSAELWYMFHTLDKSWRPFTEGDYRLSDEMVDYWTNFMKTGNPNGDNLLHWSKYFNNKEHRIFDVEE